jgi:hypothetical protein
MPLLAANPFSAMRASPRRWSIPPLPRFRPWQQVWQCNEIRVTVTARDPFSIEYDLGGTIWGGGHFTVIKGALHFNERPCLPLQPVGY